MSNLPLDFGIWTEYSTTVGLGHAVRCRHLKRELEQRGRTVGWNQPGRVNVVDRMDPRGWELPWPVSCRSVQIVGAGQTALVDVDLHIYQTGWRVPQLAPPALSGPDYLLLSPAYSNGLWFEEKKDVLVQFGAGFPWGLSLDVATDLSRMGFRGTIVRAPYHKAQYPVIRGFSYAIEPSSLRSLHASHRYLAGSMGMSTYEAVAAGCFPVVIGRTDDHLRTAFQLAEMGWCLAVPSQMDVVLGIDVASGLRRRQEIGVIDGHGVERVASVLEGLL